MKESEGDRHKYAVCESSVIPISSERIHAYVEKNNDGQSLPRVGKVASEASRIGFWRYEKDRERSSQVRRLREHPSAAARSPLPNGEGKEEAASPPKKEANPALLRSAAPSKGRGSRGHSLLPMEGGAPKGRIGHWRYERQMRKTEKCAAHVWKACASDRE